MSALTSLHVVAGGFALACGAAAILLRKGSRPHGAAGAAFAVSMVVLGVTASALGPHATPAQSPVGGLMVCYFVATGWWTAHRRSGRAGSFEVAACAGILLTAAAIIASGIERALAPPGVFTGPPAPGAVLALGAICLGAGMGDLRFIVRGTLPTRQRLARHLWRMCFAFFIATGSFFLGQQDVLPAPVRGSPVLVLLALAPLAWMLAWLVRLRFARNLAATPLAAPGTARTGLDPPPAVPCTPKE